MWLWSVHMSIFGVRISYCPIRNIILLKSFFIFEGILLKSLYVFLPRYINLIPLLWLFGAHIFILYTKISKQRGIAANFCFWNLLQLPEDGVKMKEVKDSHNISFIIWLFWANVYTRFHSLNFLLLTQVT